MNGSAHTNNQQMNLLSKTHRYKTVRGVQGLISGDNLTTDHCCRRDRTIQQTIDRLGQVKEKKQFEEMTHMHTSAKVIKWLVIMQRMHD
jgi:hypothetical protein